MMNRDREKMAYWYYLQQQKNKQQIISHKLYCKMCGKEIMPGSTPQLRYGVGIICKECSDKRWKKLGTR